MKWVYLTLCCALMTTNVVHSDDWQGHWFNGANAFRNNEFDKAIEEYTLAINSTDGSKHLYLYSERADAYFKAAYLKPENYKKAIQDLSTVIDNKDTSPIDRANALWLRGQAYLAAGMKEEFTKDSKQLEKIEPYFTQLEENENYASFKLGNLTRFNKNVEKTFIKMLLVSQVVNSEKDVIFTLSGMGIVKKAQGSNKLTNLFDLPQKP